MAKTLDEIHTEIIGMHQKVIKRAVKLADSDAETFDKAVVIGMFAALEKVLDLFK